MKALFSASGKGTNIKPVTTSTVKQLLPHAATIIRDFYHRRWPVEYTVPGCLHFRLVAPTNLSCIPLGGMGALDLITSNDVFRISIGTDVRLVESA